MATTIGIGADDEIDVAVRDARRVALRAVAEAQVTGDGAVALRQPGIVQHGEFQALEVGRPFQARQPR